MSFAVKLAAGVILVSAFIGIVLRFSADNNGIKSGRTSMFGEDDNTPIYSVSGRYLLIPIIHLPVNKNSKEKAWIEQLANRLNGSSEVEVKYGRVDVMTSLYAIEVDFISKWKEGLGQAIHYGNAANKIGVLAIIDNTRKTETQEEHLHFIHNIEQLCTEKGVKLILLKIKKE